jgi:hypothetical protein
MFFLYLFKNTIIFNFVIFMATKKVGQQFSSPSSFAAVVGSGILDLDLESGMDKSPDPRTG